MIKDRTNTTFRGYRLSERLGMGAFGDVYLSQKKFGDQLLNVAVKILTIGMTKRERDQFIDEIKIVCIEHHPNIVRIRDFGIDQGSDGDDVPYLVMDYAPNKTLRDRHLAGNQVPLSTTVKYVSSIADALHHLHKHKIMHRDVKPDNILIGVNDELLLSDFGLATSSMTGLISIENPKYIRGTYRYMAPEQFRGELTRKSDQYSLAIVVYELLSGEPPFTGDYVQLHIQHVKAPVPPLGEKVPSLPIEVERVILRALAKAPEERYATTKDFADALVDAYHRHGPAPSPVLPPPHVRPDKPYGVVQKIDGKTKEEWYDEGRAYSKDGRYPEAIDAYTKAIRLDKGFAEAYNNRGLAYYRSSNTAEAISDFDVAIYLDPKFAPAYYNRGHAYTKQGNHSEAIKDLEIALTYTSNATLRQKIQNNLDYARRRLM